MNTHKNARLTPHGRALLAARVIDEGLWPREVAQAQGVRVRTVYKWMRRFRKEGHAGLQDRTSRPVRSPSATDAATVEQVIERCQQRQTYPDCTGAGGRTEYSGTHSQAQRAELAGHSATDKA